MHRSPLQFSALTALLATLLLGPTVVHARTQTTTSPAATRYEVTDLGSLGGEYRWAGGINAAGQVVGDSTTAPGQEPNSPGTHAFLWDRGTMTDLGTLGGDMSTAIDINDAGQVVGFSETAEGTQHAFRWENGAMTDLGTLGGGSHSEGIRINEAGQVVGHATTAPGQELLDPGTRAFLWSEGVMTDLGTLGGNWSRATGINKVGQIVGTPETADGAIHPFLWEDGTMTDLGVLPGFEGGRAIRISEEGLVVGFSVDPLTTPGAGPPAERHAWLYREGELTDLGTLGRPNSFALGVNAAGQVVGSSEIAAEVTAPEDASPGAEEDAPPSHAFIWEDRVMTDLNVLMSGESDLVLETAYVVNDAGQIVGVAVAKDEYHAFLLTPID